MPKNTQMHMQWITVNGQSVPLVLPQYWDGEKWVISSEQNPLPVKAELTGSKIALSFINRVNIPAGSHVNLVSRSTQYAPNGHIKEIEYGFQSNISSNFIVQVYHYADDPDYLYSFIRQVNIEHKNSQRIANRVDAYGNAWRVAIFNVGEEEVNISVAGAWGLF